MQSSKPILSLITRPGHGWKHLSGPVWERTDGVRVHVAGLVRLADGSFHSANTIAHSSTVARLTRINGGSRKRGLMAWAATMAAEADDQK